MKIRKNELILLSGGGRKYLTSCAGKFSCKFGSVNLDLFVGKKFGIKIKIGKEKFSAIKPNVLDILRFAKRGPQVILSKDSSAIASVTGCGKGWKVLDAGSGSGFNAIFLANLGCEVLTAEKDKRFFRLAERNILTSNSISPLKIQIKNSPVEKLFRKEHFDLITLDLQNSQKLVRKSFSALKPGGWLCITIGRFAKDFFRDKKSFWEFKNF